MMVILFVFLIIDFSSAKGWSNADWMGRMGIGNFTLQEITIPGTHDSGSYQLTDELVDIPLYIEEIVLIADELGLPVSEIINWWAQTQTRDFFTQFLDGIRYVDLRIFYDNSSNIWKTHHGPVVGNPIEVILQNTQRFLSLFPSEVIVIEMSHDFGQTLQQEQMLIDLINEYLSSRLWSPAMGFQPINKMISSGKNVIVTLTFDILPDTIWPGSTIINSYANSPVLSKMEQYNLQQIKLWEQHSIFPNQLYKISWILTPNDETILETIIPGCPHTVIELGDIANNDLENFWNNFVNPNGFKYPIFANILIIDDYTNSPIIDIVQQGIPGN